MSLKSELKNGAVVQYANGAKAIKIDDMFVNLNGVGFVTLLSYDDNLIVKRNCNSKYNIQKINNDIAFSLALGVCTVDRPLYEVLHENIWTWERHVEILDQKEKEYLSAVIKPFRDICMKIIKCDYLEHEFIKIILSGEVVNLPFFKAGAMYKGMETGKEYTLEELGL